MESEERISVVCENCNGRFKVKAIAAGRFVKCPACSTKMQVPIAAPDAFDDATLEPTMPVSDSPLPLNDSSGSLGSEDFPAFENRSFSSFANPVERTVPQSAKTNVATEIRSSQDRDFSTLRLVAKVFVICGYAMIVIALVGTGLIGLATITLMVKGAVVAIFVGVFSIAVFWVACVVSVISFMASSELIRLFIQIEKNTYGG